LAERDIPLFSSATVTPAPAIRPPAESSTATSSVPRTLCPSAAIESSAHKVSAKESLQPVWTIEVQVPANTPAKGL
jgi:hypothetical protein